MKIMNNQIIINLKEDGTIKNIETTKEQELQDRIKKAIEYIEKFEDIKAYYSYEENGYEEYNYDEDFKKDLLNILKGENER